MADKSPKKPTNKKVGKSLKEKRADQNATQADKNSDQRPTTPGPAAPPQPPPRRTRPLIGPPLLV